MNDDDRIEMPHIKKGVEVAALCIGDVHLSDRCPISRAEKKNWFDVQYRVLGEISSLQKQYQCPVLIAGDLFDRWNPSLELVNMVIENMPDRCYGIPGNHDLPNHNYKEIHRTSYWTLVVAKKIVTLTPGGQWGVDHLLVSPFPCGFKVEPPKNKHGLALNVALVHDYAWTEKTGHPGAPEEKRYAKWMKKLIGYDVAVFSDNHRGWLIQKDESKCRILNCGALIRRKSDEISYTPSVGLLHSNGNITRHYLDVSSDQFSDIGKEIAAIESTLQVDLSGFVEELAEQKRQGATWKEAVKLWIKNNKLNKSVEKIIISAVEGSE